MKIFKQASVALVATSLLVLLSSCDNQPKTSEKESGEKAETSLSFSVPFETFTLENGLTVILHIDRSDPVVAVALTSHVGSARELPGRTGFAHLFEHLLFLESENLGKGGLDRMSARIGGSGANGSTSRDRTNYFQTVPNDALEKMIWAEADKLGYFINTVTETGLAQEKQVVKNEKRQSGDNRPYGHTQYVIDKNLYPEGHPYNWQVIGSLDDLQNATLADVKNFYNKWYTPNNVTLTIAGDFNIAVAKSFVHKYFDEIKRGPTISPRAKRPVTLQDTKNLYFEDNFAKQSELTYAWPSVYEYHKDSYALEVLADYLTNGKKAPFNRVLVDDKKLTSGLSMYNYNSELAGEILLSTRVFGDNSLDSVAEAMDEAFSLFESEGISEADLTRIKARQETAYYNSLSSTLGKAFQLAQYNIFAGDPAYIEQDIKNILAVTTADVMNVYAKYIKDKHHVVTSFVPKGKLNLALSGSTKANVVEEKIVEGAETSLTPSDEARFERSPSSFDRTIEPAYGTSPVIPAPVVWDEQLSSGLKVYGINTTELPLVQFTLTIDGGLLLDDPNKVGVSNLLGEVMNKGTKNKTAAELEEAIESLGAYINVVAGSEGLYIQGNTLTRNYPAVMELVSEMLLEPRFDEGEFELAKLRSLDSLQSMAGNPNSIADNEYRKLIYGKDHILSNNSIGTQDSVGSITLDDLKSYYTNNISPTVAKFHIVGDVVAKDVMISLEGINNNWKPRQVSFPSQNLPEPISQSKVYFYDVPDAKQSLFRFGYLALSATNADYYPAAIMNYKLGGGGFASKLTQQVRENKGYTYGIRSRFSGTLSPGPFTISSGVRSNVTFEAANLIKDILDTYGPDFSAEDHQVTKNYLLKSQARAFETLRAKLSTLQNISQFGWPNDYAKQRAEIIRATTVEDIQKLATKYLDSQKMIYLVVGDAKTQLEKLKGLGFGDPIKLN